MGFDLTGLFSYQTKADSYDSASVANSMDTVKEAGREDADFVRNLSDFPKGSTVMGQIVDRKQDAVLIRLSDNTYVNARLEQGVNVSVGQRLTFEVKSNSGNTLSLTPLFTNMNGNTNVIKGLAVANIPLNDSTIAMITSMMDKGMSIDTASLQKLYRQMLAYPQTRPQTLVEMNELSLPVTKENITQFEAYQNYGHKLLTGVKELLETVQTTCLDLVSRGNTKEAAGLYRELTEMLSGTDTGQEESLKGVLSKPERVLLAGQLKGLVSAEVRGAVVDGTISMKQLMELFKQLSETGKALVNEDATSFVNTMETETTFGIWQKTDGGNQAEPEAASSIRQKTDSENQAEPEAASSTSQKTDTGKPSAAEAAPGTLQKADRDKMAEPKSPSEPNLSGTQEKITEWGNIEKQGNLSEGLQRLYTSEPFLKVMNKQISELFLLTPDKIAQKGEVSRYYNRLNEQTMRLITVLSAQGGETMALTESASALKQNLEFINQLNLTFSYVQLPLKLEQRTGHGELYVYTNKKNLAKREGSISALLHLDMEYLGAVDVYVTMTGTDHVNTKFYLQEEELLSFIESHIHLLNERLEKRGYCAGAELVVRKKEKDIEFSKKLLGETKEKPVVLSTQAFDMRA